MSIVSRAKPLLILFAVGLILGIGATAIWFYHTLGESKPSLDGEFSLVGVDQPISITTDSMGISQIFAQTHDDACFALGWLHASNRMFQMDLVRRLSHGRLGSMLGAAALPHDSTQLMFGHARMAREALPRLSERNRILLQSYCDGINAWLAHTDAKPFEHVILGLEIDRWTVHDCLTLLSFQTWFSDALQNRDEILFKLARTNGSEMAATLTGDYPGWAPTTVPEPPGYGAATTESAAARQFRRSVSADQRSAVEETWWDRLNPRSRLRAELLQSLRRPGSMSMSHSSNAWAAAPERTQSGASVFANDPHLDITRLPQFWYAVAVHVAEDSSKVLGITAPGLPFVSMGHNGTSAWGFTAGGIDITEYYKETLNPDDSTQYLTPDGWTNLEVATDSILDSEGWRPIEIRKTRNGPIMHLSDTAGIVYAIRWAGFDADLADVVAAAFALPHATDFDTFRKTVVRFGAFDASWVYADRDTIGFQLGTPVPVRPKETYNLPIPGFIDEYQWQGYRPLQETPHAANPAQEFLASNNNAPARDLDGNFAADRILSSTYYLLNGTAIDAAYMHRMQMDLTDRYLKRWKPELVRLLQENGYTDWASRMKTWDGSATPDSRPTLLVNLFLSQMIRFTFDDEIGDDTLTVRFLWMDHVYHTEDTLWFDDIATDTIVETRHDISRRALDSAIALADDRAWGDALTLTIRHPMAAIPLVSNLLDLEHGPYPGSGTAGTLKASFFREEPQGNFSVFVGPSWRMIVDLADPNGATVCLPAGNSGHPQSPYFFNFFDFWREGGRWPVPLDSAMVEERAAHRLILSPPRQK